MTVLLKNSEESTDLRVGMVSVGAAVLSYISDRSKLGELRPGSAKTIGGHLWLFAEFVGTERDVRRVGRRDVERWLMSRDVAATTVRGRLSSVRGLAEWLVVHGHIRRDFTLGIRGPKQPRELPPRGLDSEKVGNLFRACPDSRAELVVSLMVQEGLRCMEVAGLQLGDIDWRRQSMLVHGKGGHQRVLPISSETWDSLTRYLLVNPAPAGPLIRNYRRPNQGLSPKWISRLVGNWMREVEAAETAHALRHTMASDMLEHGAHIRDVQYALGHRSIATTERYLRWLVGELRDAMGGRSYRHPDDPPT